MRREDGAPDCWPAPRDLALLRAALLADPAAALAARDTWGDADPRTSGVRHVLPLLHDRLRVLRPEDPWLPLLREEHDRTRYRALLRLQETADALAALRAVGVEGMLLKGAALLAGYGVDPAHRPMADVDVLVRPGRLAEARQALLAHGWGVAPSDDPAAHAAGCFSPSGAALDLHVRSLETAPEGGDDDLWANALPGSFFGVQVLVPPAEDLLVQVLAHGMRHTWDAPHRWVADACLLLRAAGPLDGERIAARAAAADAVAAVRDGLAYLERELAWPVPPPGVPASLEEAPQPRWRRWAEEARRRRPDRRGPVLALALVVDDHRRLAAAGAVRRGVRGFLQVWQRAWALTRPWGLPLHVVGRGLRRAWQLGRKLAPRRARVG